MSVNEAKQNYLAKVVDIDVQERCENSSESNIVCKEETTDALAEDDEIACQAMGDEADFATVFCEVFIPDCDPKMQEVCDETPKRKNCERNTKTTEALSTTDRMVTRRKSERTNINEKCSGRNSAKKSSNSLNADLACEFCGKLFPSFNEAQVHYVKEHSNSNGESRGHGKRIKR